MKHKVLLLDFDGVISPGKYFSDIYSEEFGVDKEKIMPFFNNMKASTNVGISDLKESLKSVVKDWEWSGTIDELLKYWFASDSDIDERVKELALKIKDSSISVYLATDQEKYRTQFIWEEKDLKDWLDGKFVSCELGYTKSQPEFFKLVLETLEVSPEDVLFFDDSQSKVNSAKKNGIDAYLYTDFESFQEIINKEISKT